MFQFKLWKIGFLNFTLVGRPFNAECPGDHFSWFKLTFCLFAFVSLLFFIKKNFLREIIYFKIVKTITFSIFPCYLQVLFFYRHKYSFSIGKKWLFGERFIIFSERRVQSKYRQLLDWRQPDPIKLVLLVIIGWLVTQFYQKRL